MKKRSCRNCRWHRTLTKHKEICLLLDCDLIVTNPCKGWKGFKIKEVL